jgi:hypothetical protein
VICVEPFVSAGNDVRWTTALGAVLYESQVASRKSEKRLTRYSDGQPDTTLFSLIVKLVACEFMNCESTGVNDLSVTPVVVQAVWACAWRVTTKVAAAMPTARTNAECLMSALVRRLAAAVEWNRALRRCAALDRWRSHKY